MNKDMSKPGKIKRYGVRSLLMAGLPCFVSGGFVTTGVN
jgi:hypothetical protein